MEKPATPAQRDVDTKRTAERPRFGDTERFRLRVFVVERCFETKKWGSKADDLHFWSLLPNGIFVGWLVLIIHLPKKRSKIVIIQIFLK